ncbi:MAG: GyrI-like domain-containing protein [Chloroflexi bacterium]|nr:GyrI-like domain-containing protein [Chloroflexota bacterium]
MLKLDLRQQYAAYLKPSAKAAQLVDVPPLTFLMIDGRGNPNTAPSYKAAVEALYSVSYTLKFHFKKTRGLDYGVMPLEGLWWADDMDAFLQADKDAYLWTMMILQPDVVTPDVFAAIKPEVAKKKALPALDALRLETYHEGLCAQILHIGPYAAEGPTIQRLHEFIAAQGKQPTGKHHEIYLGDPNKSAPDKLKTIIRQPMG